MTARDEPGPPATVLRLLPNALTLARIALAAFFPLAPPGWRIAVVAAAAASDALDGWIARRYGVTTWIGALLDGIADKALTLAVLATFAAEGALSWPAVVLVMIRDLVVTAIALYLACRRAWAEITHVTARAPGKVTTLAVYVLMAVLLLAPGLAAWVLWPAVVLSILAAIDYAIIFLSVQPERR